MISAQSSLIFVPCSTWAADFRGAILRHYTQSKGAPVGKKQGWRIVEYPAPGTIEETRIIGWIGLGEPSYKLAPRRRLGLVDARPLPKTVSNFIFRLEGPRHATASAILKAWLPVAADEWDRRYGWRPVHWESMVGQGDAKNLGACFRRAGWRKLGWTTGRTARRQSGNSHGKREWMDSSPKLVFYKGPLARKCMRELALFAGGGGGILGGILLGWRTVCAVEIDPYCRSVLLARQRDGVLLRFPIWDDVCTFDGRQWRGHIDVVSGGFPCQPFSGASRGRRTAPDRWPDMLRIISECRPRWVFAENVPRTTTVPWPAPCSRRWSRDERPAVARPQHPTPAVLGRRVLGREHI